MSRLRRRPYITHRLPRFMSPRRRRFTSVQPITEPTLTDATGSTTQLTRPGEF